ncbi:hypothetical protein pb186bvf_001773 [Paramecium bursaria]
MFCSGSNPQKKQPSPDVPLDLQPEANTLAVQDELEENKIKAPQKLTTEEVEQESTQGKLIQHEEPINFQQLPQKEIVIKLQDEASIQLDCKHIQEQSMQEDFPSEEELAEGYDEEDDRELDEQEAYVFRWTKVNHNFAPEVKLDDIFSKAKNLKCIQTKEESRFSMAHSGGGKVCKNKRLVQTLRVIGKQLINQIGQKILSGNLNLTTISFPIRAMIPKSALEKILLACRLFPLYINKAAMTSDPIERFKLLICATLGNFYINCSFLKPLNPILGETISGSYSDGTKVYAEQISHHPPVSYFYAVGPESSYKFYGYCNYEAQARLNSLTLKNMGKRQIVFADGQLIEYNFAGEEYSGSFWGHMKVESKGKMTFTDSKNEITASVEFDSVSQKPSDYLSGEIKVKGQRVCKIYGSYLGYIEFGDQRYWDVNYIKDYPCHVDKPNVFMKSDASFRQDLRMLRRNKLVEAQAEQDQLEFIQRQDGRLRKN